MEVSKKEITILVNGKIEKETKRVLQNLRELFPENTIILSTWKKSNVTNLDFDILIENEDPGADFFNVPRNFELNKTGIAVFSRYGKKYKNSPKENNVNRIIQTINGGIKYVNTKYLLRIRTDVILKNSNFLKYWDKFPKHNGKYKIFEHRIINDSSFAQYAHVMKDGTQLLPFHMSDWIHFGLTEDIKLLYSCPFQDIDNSAQYWYKHERKQYEPFLDAGWQYPPETYVLFSLVKQKFPEVEFKDSDDYNCENMSISNMVMADNFIFVDQNDFEFDIDKYPKLHEWSSELYNGFITHREWQYLYKTYCDNSYRFCDIDIKRFVYFKNLLSLKLLLKYPGRYFRQLKDLSYIFCKKSLRKKFYIGVCNED